MEKTIELRQRTVTYTLRQSSRARRLRLTVACGGVFTVTAPQGMRQGVIDRFIMRKTEWVLDTIERLGAFPACRSLSKWEQAREFAEHKEKALLLVRERLLHFNRFYGRTWKKITIRNQRSRWGSCSRTGNLCFNYRIALLPAHLADYIIVHELCHLKELNHSRKFWDLVAKTVPEHRRLRAELRRMSYDV